MALCMYLFYLVTFSPLGSMSNVMNWISMSHAAARVHITTSIYMFPYRSPMFSQPL